MKKQSTDAYYFRRNRLTELLNRESITDELTTQISNFQVARVEPDNVQVSDSKFWINRIAVISIDIDNFKSVNDDFGHAYGDVVLLSVAGRLEKSAAALTEKHIGRIQVLPAHPSGEEFIIRGCPR